MKTTPPCTCPLLQSQITSLSNSLKSTQSQITQLTLQTNLHEARISANAAEIGSLRDARAVMLGVERKIDGWGEVCDDLIGLIDEKV